MRTMKKLIILITALSILLSVSVSAEISYTPKKLESVPQIYQLPELPWGCEATALTGLCNYYGYSFTKKEIWDRTPKREFEIVGGRVYAEHPDVSMTMASKGVGFGIYAPLAVKILNQMISEAGGPYIAVDHTGCTEAELFQNLPKVVWASGKMEPTIPDKTKWYLIKDGVYTDEAFYWQGNEHAMVLLSVTDTTVRVMDPISGTVNYNKETFLKEWKNQGCQVLSLEKQFICRVYVNTYKVDFKDDDPVIDGEKIYAPVIPILRMLGLKIFYEEKYQEIMVYRDDKFLLHLKGGSDTVILNGETLTVESAAKVFDGVLMIDIDYLTSIQNQFWCNIEYKVVS